MSKITFRLQELGLVLPQAPASLANYVGWVRTGSLVFTAGQGPVIGGKLQSVGILGAGISLEEGFTAARLTALNVLAQVAEAVEGDLGRIVRCVKLTGFVASTPDFTEQAAVMNGASDLIVSVMGELGSHVRSAVGVAALPKGMPIEIEGIFEVR